RMQNVRSVVALGRKLREDHRIKVRQPLAKLTVVHRDPTLRAHVTSAHELIEDELNVKRVDVEADESAFTSVSVKPNFKTLGKRCGSKLKDISAVLAKWGFAEVERLEAGESVNVAGEALTIDDVILQRKAAENTAVATDGHVTVVLDTQIDAPLRREGLAREFTSLVQNTRKESGLEVTDRIALTYDSGDSELLAALEEHAASIQRETLALSLVRQAGGTEAKLNGIALSY